MSQTRREFLGQVTSTLTLAAAAGSPVGAAATAPQARGTAGSGAAGLSELRQVFLAPPDAARPMTRWWWFGGAVTPQEITRELTMMRDAGLGGAEIQPVYPVTVDDPAKGIRHQLYFSPELTAALRHASREARRLGLRLDLTLGSGWPYGGPFIPLDLAARRLRVFTQDVDGPRRFAWDYTALLGDGDHPTALVLTPIGKDGAPDVAGARVLDPARRLVANGVDIPAGRWRLSLFLDSPTYMQVKRPTWGMEGPVIDHHNRDAIATFLRSAGDRVFEQVGTADGPPFHGIFCDSLEVYGADWTGRLQAEFEKRRGYALAPYLPALAGEAGPLTPHVRYDYHLTLSDLIIEEFFTPLVAWSGRHGVTARIQAHGAMGDVMRGYGLADIPEGETIFLGDRYQVILKHRRIASSAAHIYGKSLASAESYTWLRTPMFTTTLEMMKAASDSAFLDGINHIVNHGYAYSPPEAGEPGWCFYASTEVNHTQTWWRHYPHLAQYVQRVSALLRQGEAVNPILVYLPIADVYAGHGLGGLHLDQEVESRLDPKLADSIRQAGYDFDVVNDHALAELMRVEGGRLRGGTGRYSVVIVSRIGLMPPESAARIAEFVRAGGHLIVIGELPREAPGVKDHDSRTTALRQALAGLWGGAAPSAAPAVSPTLSAALVADVPAALARLARVLPPDFRIASGGAGATADVGFVHRRVGDNDCYFVANVSGDRRHLRAEFRAGHRVPELWRTEGDQTGVVVPYRYVTRPGGDRVTEVELALAPFESCFVVFGADTRPPLVIATDARCTWEITREGRPVEIRGLAPEAGSYTISGPPGRTRRVSVTQVPKAITVAGPWSLTLGSKPAVRLDRLVPWSEIEQGRGFSGWGVYEAALEVPDLGADVEWFVDLGIVHETAQVLLNGKDLGAAWKGLRRVPCGGAIARDANRLRIEVANLWIHHVLAHPPGDPERHLKGVGTDREVAETAGIRWGTYGEVPAKDIPPSGLLGPVRLVAMKRMRVRL